MLFNSFEFLIFLPTVWAAYWCIPRHWLNCRNLFIIAASYTFYGWFDWRFLGLIFASSLTDYLLGPLIASRSADWQRRIGLVLSLAVNLGILGVFKYFNFFADGVAAAFGSVGIELSPFTLEVALPVGISFYTFQTLGYSIDVYWKKIKPEPNPLSFFAFVCFFPQLVAGPVERAKDLLPQFKTPRYFDAELAKDGLRQVLWGMTKKVVIADTLAPVVDTIYAAPDEHSRLVLMAGAFLFSIQIYCDFSGYSDIAIGSAKLFGFKLSTNFNKPLLSASITDVWRRWNISLSSWFRDYVYIPLGGSRRGGMILARNLVITMAVSGLWHGANITMVAWGLTIGFYLVSERTIARAVTPATFQPTFGVTPVRCVQTVLVLMFFSLSLILFRAPDAAAASLYYQSLVLNSGVGAVPEGLLNPWIPVLIASLFAVEIATFHSHHPLQMASWPTVARWSVYLFLCLVVLDRFGGEQAFIYFQF